MNRLTILLGIVMISSSQPSASYIDQDFDSQLNVFQQNIALLVSQSNLDPEVAQDIINSSNELNKYIQNNIQQDLKEIRVAAGLTSILETADKMIQNLHNTNLTNIHDLLSGFKYAARANAIHALLIGAYPGKFKDQPYYTDPYTETIGFTINDYLFYHLFHTLVDLITPTELGKVLYLDSTSPIKKWAIRVATGVAAHFAWLIQKKVALTQLAKNQK